ncbi:NADH-quinone oxidoreductase subunit F [Buchnera aphidicola (Cinara kochiana kochiana)]|uniref:NADH-quinone oxidoreductase subunit F n=1 Tax=Buchnera aphidicola (Cinara kochiana kochiana) TaxID=2518976 RepID=A0A451D5D2_9GAMM|nr:NADH-quinone oxidoreductase subunit NuoF [Buchnera aphidicola]VFP81026.1 NADH-quinone oxidoreductase subunit F [Buchnera aphidicola (Cinara kochiana kochiana)]
MKHILKNPETHPLTWRLKKYCKPVKIIEYCNTNGYQALKKSLKYMNSNEIISLVKKSGLKGRGGAGFPTGNKWDLMSTSSVKDIRYLICNADEMEPGTYKDRFLIEYLPHQLIEGIIISAFALQAECGYIFLRGDYYLSEKILTQSIRETYQAGFLGENILNSGFTFNLFVHTGAGRYICGEETALINSLEGKRANPRYKPPFPANFGLWGKPTCVNNVETLSNIPAIILYGANWYLNLSKSIDSGTKLLGFSGRVKRPGLWELPLGITAREVLEDYAGGMQKKLTLQAWQPGGAGTSLLSYNDIDIKMDFTSLQKIGSRLGTGIAMAIDDKVNIISLLVNIEKFFSRESCGFCTPCREGLPWIVKILQSLENKNGYSGDISILEQLCTHLESGKTFCAHAPGAISPLKSAIKLFRNDFKKGINLNNKKQNNIDIVSLYE